jgi:hypothetical protein
LSDATRILELVEHGDLKAADTSFTTAGYRLAPLAKNSLKKPKL